METWHKVLLLTSIYVSFLLTGTLIFQALEKGEEEILRVQVRNNLMKFLVNNTCVEEWELRFIVNEVVHAYSYGLRFEDSNMTSFGKHLWDFSNSLFFATTVITTIGKAKYFYNISLLFFCFCFVLFCFVFSTLQHFTLIKPVGDLGTASLFRRIAIPKGHYSEKNIKGALDKFNIIPQLFKKKVGIFIPLEVLAWVMTACGVLRSRLTYL